jgi:hypothetical protein
MITGKKIKSPSGAISNSASDRNLRSAAADGIHGRKKQPMISSDHCTQSDKNRLAVVSVDCVDRHTDNAVANPAQIAVELSVFASFPQANSKIQIHGGTRNRIDVSDLPYR